MGKLTEYIASIAANKKKLPQIWLREIVNNIDKCTLATHVGKFTNPDVEDVNIFAEYKKDCHGYVVTSNTNCDIDISVTSASYMGTAKFLLLKLEDNITVLQHIQEHDVEIKNIFKNLGIDFLEVYDAVMKLTHPGKLQHTDQKLKQVYFPINSQAYHLLTVLPASGLLIELKNRIIKMNQNSKACRDSKTELYGENYSRVMDMTAIGIGGTKPQNISTLNSEVHGVSYLLPSLPPIIYHQEVCMPKVNFFTETIPFKEYVDTFKKFHALLRLDKNNVEIRDKIKETIVDVIDIIVLFSYKVRMKEAGWSRKELFKSLPIEQKIWLDNNYIAERKQGDWIDPVSQSFGRWFINRYEKIAKKEKFLLGDVEFNFLKREMRTVLTEEVKYNI